MPIGEAHRLVERVVAQLSRQGGGVDAARLVFPADFVRLVVRALRMVKPQASERAALVAAIRAHSDLPLEVVEHLIDVALTPSFRASLGVDELRAYTRRFGQDAAQALVAEDQDDVDLASFAARYGPGEALLLLDVLFGIAGADGVLHGDELVRLRAAAVQLQVDEAMVAALIRRYDPRHATGDLRFPVVGDRMVIGRGGGCHAVLPDPQVALRHCELVRVDGGWNAVDLGSGRPTLVNGVPVRASRFGEHDLLRLGPYTLQLRQGLAGELALVADGARSFSALSVRGLTRKIGDVSLLDDVSFTVFSGEVVAMIGPSGAGKTTLLNAINGIAPADSGEVLLDGRHFHPQLRADPSLVGIVPQDDLVLPELRVDESLWYSGRLRYSADVDDRELQAEVDRVLGELGISHIAGNRIGDALRRGISGGQRKRVNLGQELMTRSTRVLFLDEPTSGLDPRAAQDIVRLARQLADHGRMVFLVTHDLTPEVIAQVDHLLVMAAGGRLAWFGPPEGANAWFGVSSPDAIFNRFADRPADEWGRHFRQSVDFRKFVSTREHLLRLDPTSGPETAAVRAVRPSARRQLVTLTSRFARVKWRDRTGAIVLAAQPPILAVVMWLVFPEPTAPMIFMLSLSALWFGMSAAVRELIADRIVWRRERRVGVGVVPYLASKVLVMGAIVAVQCLSLVVMLWFAHSMGDFCIDPAAPDPMALSCVNPAALAGVNVLTGWAGMALGLFVSASWTSSEAAVGTLPILIIPQIMFSGIMVSLRHMGDTALGVTWLTIERFSFHAHLRAAEKIAQFDRTGQVISQSVTGSLYDFGFLSYGPEELGSLDVELSMAALLGMLVAHSLVFLAGAAGLVWWRDRRS